MGHFDGKASVVALQFEVITSCHLFPLAVPMAAVTIIIHILWCEVVIGLFRWIFMSLVVPLLRRHCSMAFYSYRRRLKEPKHCKCGTESDKYNAYLHDPVIKQSYTS